MIRRFLIALMLLAASVQAEAGYYTDIWYKASESGWGVNLVQTDSYIFATFFIYGKDGKPTWYVASLDYDNVSKSFKGDVFATTGTFFGIPWVAANATDAKVGTASFKPSAENAYQGTLSYTVTGVGSATNVIERQSLTAPTLAGSYAGGQMGFYSQCTKPSDDSAYRDYYDLKVTHAANNNATFIFDYRRADGTSGFSCTLSGALIQNGQLYRIANATYKCTGDFPLNTTASMSEIKQTSQGIEGRFFAPDVGDGCSETASFSAAIE
jgi:hypothetical protein